MEAGRQAGRRTSARNGGRNGKVGDAESGSKQGRALTKLGRVVPGRKMEGGNKDRKRVNMGSNGYSGRARLARRVTWGAVISPVRILLARSAGGSGGKGVRDPRDLRMTQEEEGRGTRAILAFARVSRVRTRTNRVWGHHRRWRLQCGRRAISYHLAVSGEVRTPRIDADLSVSSSHNKTKDSYGCSDVSLPYFSWAV